MIARDTVICSRWEERLLADVFLGHEHRPCERCGADLAVGRVSLAMPGARYICGTCALVEAPDEPGAVTPGVRRQIAALTGKDVGPVAARHTVRDIIEGDR